MRPLRPGGAPDEGGLAVCPHCWHVNVRAARLCAGCGADMTTALQESGGLRHAAPVQSPVPVRTGGRLTLLQRLIVLGFVALLALATLLGAFLGPAGRSPARAPTPVPGGH